MYIYLQNRKPTNKQKFQIKRRHLKNQTKEIETKQKTREK